MLAGCANLPSSAELDAMTDRIVKASFRTERIATVDRILATDETNRLCSQADAAGKPLDEKTAKRIEETNFKAIKWPSDGKFLGDWKQGESIAQSRRRWQLLQLPPDQQRGNLLRHTWPEPVQLRQDSRCQGPQ
jgi:sulfur-oxidizing protein SoxX